MYHWNTPLKDLIRQVKEQLYYTSTERRGILLLCVITLIFGIAPYAVAWIYPKKIPEEAALTRVVSLLADTIANTKRIAQGRLFAFDPNTATSKDLVALGVPEHIANRILHYREKGGKFFNKEGLKRIYGFPEDLYLRLEPYIEMESDRQRQAQQDADFEEPLIPRFNFDPNAATAVELQRLGLPAKVIQNMMKYREKGGSFKYKEDVSKIYGMPEKLYLELESFILLPAKKDNPAAEVATIVAGKDIPASYQAGSFPKKSSTAIDINRATVEEWQQLKGIGPAFAKRIVTFREKLGGFYTIGQVAETFGLPDSTYQYIQPLLILSPVLQKININTASEEVLAAHPYIKRAIARIIVNYRSQHGPFSIPQDLYKIQALSEEAVAKMVPYVATVSQ